MTLAQKLRGRRQRLHGYGRDFPQIDLFSWPRRMHRRQWRDRVRIGIGPAQRIGMPALGAARVEHKIVKVPQHEGVVALGRPQAIAVAVDLEKDLAVDKEREKLKPWKILLPAKLFDALRRGKQGQSSGDLRVADFEQRAGARRF